MNVVIFQELYFPFALALVLCFVLFLGSYALLRNWYKAGILASISLLFAENYVVLFDFVRKTPMDRIIQGKQSIGFIFVGIALTLLFIFLKNTNKNLFILTVVCNIFTTILVVLLLIQIVSYQIYTRSINVQTIDTPYNSLVKNIPREKSKLPDIYYFIFDRFASDKTLIESYGYNNVSFSKNLSKMGFFVSSDSWANYTSTGLSLASSLNFMYLDGIKNLVGVHSSAEQVLFPFIENNSIMKYLESLGYQYIHSGSWWGMTAQNKYADRNIKDGILTEFAQVMFARTIFYPVDIVFNLPVINSRYIQWKRVQFKFSEIAKIATIKEPTFLFAHFLIPHFPYVFDRSGNFVSEDLERNRDEKDNYIGQVEYVSNKILTLVDALLSQSKENKPIIILQSDEGPYPKEYDKTSQIFDWKKAAEKTIQQKMGILYAVYFPDGDYSKFTNSISPVNTFRILLNKYFNQHLQILPNNSFLSNKGKLFDFVKIIERDSNKK